MKDAKSLLLLLVSLLLVLVSFVLIWTWGYRYYTSQDEYKVNAKIVLTDSSTIVSRIRDSLQRVYDETINKLDSRLDSSLITSDSIKTQLDIKLTEFFRLSYEIKALLSNRSDTKDFTVAKQKIGELQNKAQDLKAKAQLVESENKSLKTVLEELNKTEKNKPVTPPAGDAQSLNENVNPVFAVFNASDIRLTAMTVNDEAETETNIAEQANKLVGAFTVTNNISQLSNVEIMVVVLQPDGRVLKNSEWDSGSFNTADGKKIYSYKLNFNYLKGEQKRLLFSLKADKYQKGSYTMQVYHNGIMIGRVFKTLS
jgi:regulator of replication initiation timing